MTEKATENVSVEDPNTDVRVALEGPLTRASLQVDFSRKPL